MSMTTKKWLVLSTVAGIVVYYCEWLELIYPGIRNQGLGFTIARIYAIPLVVSGVLGYFWFKNPLACWLSFMLPSWIVRVIQLIYSVMDGSNLSPLLLAVDVVHLLLTGVIVGGASKLRRIHIGSERNHEGSGSI